jgi:hypothetical protein
MLAVYADGGTIYPSQWVESSLQYDNGRLASNGQDPIQKDVLELIFRLFDRSGLALVPELQFDAPLPELERGQRRILAARQRDDRRVGRVCAHRSHPVDVVQDAHRVRGCLRKIDATSRPYEDPCSSPS